MTLKSFAIHKSSQPIESSTESNQISSLEYPIDLKGCDASRLILAKNDKTQLYRLRCPIPRLPIVFAPNRTGYRQVKIDS
jgi:hypothetical protein